MNISALIPDGATWIDLAMLITQVLTFAAAVLAFIGVQLQIRAGERQHREQLLASQRPLVVLQEASIEGEAARGVYLRTLVSNVGVGPAQNVELHMWRLWLSSPGLTPQAARAEMDAAREAVDFDHPNFRCRPGTLGAGGTIERPVGIEAEFFGASAEGDYLVYMAFYDDVFGTHFPRQPRDEWVAGHVLLRRYHPDPPPPAIEGAR